MGQGCAIESEVEPLDVQYKELGTQGVRPLRKGEFEILKYGSEVWAFLSGPNALRSDSDDKHAARDKFN